MELQTFGSTNMTVPLCFFFRSEPEKKLYVKFTSILFHVTGSASVPTACQSLQENHVMDIPGIHHSN
jgi:hypothetical protein